MKDETPNRFGIQGSNVIVGSGMADPRSVADEIHRSIYRLHVSMMGNVIRTSWRKRLRDAWRVLRGRAFGKAIDTMSEDEWVEWIR